MDSGRACVLLPFRLLPTAAKLRCVGDTDGAAAVRSR